MKVIAQYTSNITLDVENLLPETILEALKRVDLAEFEPEGYVVFSQGDIVLETNHQYELWV
jgi:hypothetical protein